MKIDQEPGSEGLRFEYDSRAAVDDAFIPPVDTDRKLQSFNLGEPLERRQPRIPRGVVLLGGVVVLFVLAAFVYANVGNHKNPRIAAPTRHHLPITITIPPTPPSTITSLNIPVHPAPQYSVPTGPTPALYDLPYADNNISVTIGPFDPKSGKYALVVFSLTLDVLGMQKDFNAWLARIGDPGTAYAPQYVTSSRSGKSPNTTLKH